MICVNYHKYLSPVCLVPCGSGLLVIPGVSILPCVTLDVVSKDYYFEVPPCLCVPRLSLLCAP